MSRMYVSSMSVIAFTSILLSLSPSPSALRLPVKRGECPFDRWCARPDYDHGSDAPWLARAPVWTRPDALHWWPTPAHCHPAASHGGDGHLQDIGNGYTPRAFHGAGDGGRVYPKESGSTTVTHRASDGPLSRKIWPSASCCAGDACASTYKAAVQSPSRILPGPGKETTRTVVRSLRWSGHTCRPQYEKRARHRSARARAEPGRGTDR